MIFVLSFLSVLAVIGLIIPVILGRRCEHMWMVTSRNDREVTKRCHYCKKIKMETYL